jgi:hypothetical protein
MTSSSSGAWVLSAVLTLVVASGGCGNDTKVAATEGAREAPDGPGAAATGDEGAGNATTPNIRYIMNRVARKGALTDKIAAGLEAEPISWEKLQERSKECARLASALGQNEPPRGSKESWAKLALAYANSATSLDRAAQGKDREAALASLDQLANSCTECHREHRKMRGRGNPP